MILKHSVILKLVQGQILYKQYDATYSRLYVVLVGRIVLQTLLGTSQTADVIGHAKTGDALGEEGIFEREGTPRRDSAIAEEDTYVIEIIRGSFDQMETELSARGNGLDFLTLKNALKKQWVQKRSWR